MKPAPAAIKPSSSACLPSVAETWVFEISLSSIGSAPIRSDSARSCASWMLPTPEISAPFPPSMPSG
jgi:hypothetical protein